MPTEPTKPPIEAIVLLYPSSTQTMKELRMSLSEFCSQNNLTVADIINLCDEYDYLSISRLSQIIRYNTKPISLVTNRNILTVIPPLTLWSVLETINSSRSIELSLESLRALKEGMGIDRSEHKTSEGFRVIGHEEVGLISDWMSDLCYAVKDKGRENIVL